MKHSSKSRQHSNKQSSKRRGYDELSGDQEERYPSKNKKLKLPAYKKSLTEQFEDDYADFPDNAASSYGSSDVKSSSVE